MVLPQIHFSLCQLDVVTELSLEENRMSEISDISERLDSRYPISDILVRPRGIDSILKCHNLTNLTQMGRATLVLRHDE